MAEIGVRVLAETSIELKSFGIGVQKRRERRSIEKKQEEHEQKSIVGRFVFSQLELWNKQEKRTREKRSATTDGIELIRTTRKRDIERSETRNCSLA